jgi:murein DD-endopeptidase MepM/ murein hydrolase activator NlpD
MTDANIEAKKERHQKLFEGQYHSFVGRVWFHLKRALVKLWYFMKPSKKRLSEFMHPLDHMPPPKRLYTQLAGWSIGFLVLTSMNISNASFDGDGYGSGVYNNQLEISEISSVVSDEEGFLVKSMPLDGDPIYDQNRTEMVAHTVQSGETLSVIAQRYGVNVNSIRYANSSVANIDYLKIGQELQIPPRSGLYVDIKDGDKLAKVVESHKGNLEETKKFNSLLDDTLIAGTKLFIIDGRPVEIYIASNKSSGSSGSARGSASDYSRANLPASAEGWIKPTNGSITQYYHSGHLAYDVANRSKPPVWAAAGGVVTVASYGWNGGYGNHIWIDHGNGYMTHYAHNEELYVKVGDTVTQGQVISKMGRSGNVRGATGIHLHFEITYNGVKQEPGFMGVW